MGQSAATTPGKKSGSVFDQSAAGLGNAGKATLAAGQGFASIANNPLGGLSSTASTYNPATTNYAGYQAEDMTGAGYNSAKMTGAGYNSAKMTPAQYAAQQAQAARYNATGYDAARYQAEDMRGTGYDASSMQGSGYGAARQATPEEIQAGISTYMNPYTKDVIARSQQDINRQTEMGLRDLGATASGQGAFGGSRHGIAEGTAIGEGSKALGDISAQMRAEGYNTAAQLAGQDVANRMTAAGANQAAINQARQFTSGNTQAARMANMEAANQAKAFTASNQQAARAANQAAENAQRAFNAGNLQQARAYQAEAENAQRAFNAGNQQQMTLSNQAAVNAARGFNAGNTQAARAANQAAINTARGFNAGNTQAARAANQAAINTARGFNAGNTQAARAANQAAENEQRQYNANNLQEARQFNAGEINTAGRYNAGARTANANQAIQNRLAALTGLQGAGAQGANLAGQGMGIGQGLVGQQDQYGQQLRGINEALIGQSAGMFDRYTGQPLESTAAILNMLSGNPLSGTGKTTQTNTPGLKSTLGSALGLAGRVVP